MFSEPKNVSNRVKRILIFSVAYQPLVGGAELAVRNITDRLFNYEFDLITCRFRSQHPAEEKIGNVRVFRVGFGGTLGKYLYPVFALRLASRLHRQSPYDLIWSIMAAYAGAAALLFLRRFPAVKYLLTLQEGDALEYIQKRVRPFRKQWQRIFRRADYIQAISQFLADWARIEGAVCPIEVVPNGVDLKKFTPTSSPPILRSKTGGEREGVVIITASRLVPKNGVDILIRAMAELNTKKLQATSYKLQIVGSGPEEKKLKQLAKDLGVENLIQFVGEVPPEGIPQYLASADIFVRPSRSEGLGTAFLEAMASGLPVIATPVGGIVDFLADRQTGLFCKVDDPADLAKKILLLLEDGFLRDQISKNGRLLVENKYTWQEVAGQMEMVFKKLAV